MAFENLAIDRIIIHEIFRRNVDRTMVDPVYGNGLIHLDVEAKDALQQRITEALGSSSHGVEMSIHDASAQSVWASAKSVVDAPGDNDQFIMLSQAVTAKLAASQTSKGVPGGIVVLIDGTAGHPARPFVCIIKAEPHAGFIKRQDNGQLLLEYLKELILTPEAKLYKIGAFVRSDPAQSTAQQPTAGWRAFLFDDLITKGNRLGAAHYFYSTFLGLVFPSNSAFQTKEFHTLTKDFIRSAEIDEEHRSDLLNALTAYLKADQIATIQVGVFSETYLGTPELKDAYTHYMEQKNFPVQAIHKDLSEVASALKKRKISFGHNISLTAPPEEFEGLVRIQSIDGEADEHGQVPQWTQITIRDRIREQE
jgi:hypothetical protein